MSEEELDREDPQVTDDLVRFFRALPKAARDEYAALAERDRKFGEDIAAEIRAGASP